MRNKIPIQHFIKEKNERKAFKLEGFRSFLRYITVENGIIAHIQVVTDILERFQVELEITIVISKTILLAGSEK